MIAKETGLTRRFKLNVRAFHVSRPGWCYHQPATVKAFRLVVVGRWVQGMGAESLDIGYCILDIQKVILSTFSVFSNLNPHWCMIT